MNLLSEEQMQSRNSLENGQLVIEKYHADGKKSSVCKKENHTLEYYSGGTSLFYCFSMEYR